jgi:hypothetical protein
VTSHHALSTSTLISNSVVRVLGHYGRELIAGALKTEPGRARLLETRHEVVRGWNEVADHLVLQNQVELAQAVRRFVTRMPPPQTEKEFISAWLLEIRTKPKVRDDRDLTR